MERLILIAARARAHCWPCVFSAVVFWTEFHGHGFDQGKVLACVVTGRRSLPYEEGRRFIAAVDMSGGSDDDATLCLAHADGKTVVLDRVAKQIGGVPFNPRNAVRQFCEILKSYKISKVYGDAFGGQTFRADFAQQGVEYVVKTTSASLLYEALEPVLNAGEVELLDEPTLIEQLVSLVWRGNKITHEPNSHDDWANACALAVSVVRGLAVNVVPMVGAVTYSPVTGWSDEGRQSAHASWARQYYGGGDRFAAIGGMTSPIPPGRR